MSVIRVFTVGLAALAMSLGQPLAAQDPDPDRDRNREVHELDALDRAREMDRAIVVATAEAVLDAINNADPDAARRLVSSDAFISAVITGGDGPPRVQTMSRDVFVQGISDPTQGFVERLWDPEVWVGDLIATVRAPYDFYIHGELSHCGMDTLQLVRSEDGWVVQGIFYSVEQPPACDLHPDGPRPGL